MADTPFATAQDVEARWRPLSPEEFGTADTLCDDASDIIRTRWPDVDVRIAAGTLRAASVTRVVAQMVKRAMIVGDNEGLESRSQAAGPFSVNDKFSNPNANLYLTAEDIRLFDGVRKGRAFAVDLAQPTAGYGYGCY